LSIICRRDIYVTYMRPICHMSTVAPVLHRRNPLGITFGRSRGRAAAASDLGCRLLDPHLIPEPGISATHLTTIRYRCAQQGDTIVLRSKRLIPKVLVSTLGLLALLTVPAGPASADHGTYCGHGIGHGATHDGEAYRYLFLEHYNDGGPQFHIHRYSEQEFVGAGGWQHVRIRSRQC
jgi:hypothetical protein